MLERDLEARCFRDVEARGGLCWKWSSPGRVGVPDRIIFWPNGDVHFVEFKKPGEKPTEVQKHVHGMMRARKAKVWVVSDYPTWRMYLREVGRE